MDYDQLNLCKANIRMVPHAVSKQRHTAATRKSATSGGLVGVHKKGNKYGAAVKLGGKAVWFPVVSTREEAALQYDAAWAYLYPEYVDCLWLNFPDRLGEPVL